MTFTYEMTIALMNNDIELFNLLESKQKIKRMENIVKNKKIRNCMEYYKFKRDVIKRDNNTCKNCKINENIEVHHILPVNKFPKLVFSVDNGICLCKKCHKELHKRIGF